MEPIDTEAPENIVQFTGKKRPPPDEDRMLQAVPYGKCMHRLSAFEVDMDAGKCKCLTCGGEVSPMFVLEQLMWEESKWMRARAGYQDEMKRLAERSSTKCTHCGEMTRISRR